MTTTSSDWSTSTETGHYGNFWNPIGLVYRMLRSGHRSARSALLREGLRRLLTPLDLLLSIPERRSVAAASQRNQPLILIVGPPRCGTTLVYQVLERYCDISCLTNLTSLFPRAPITGTRLFGRPKKVSHATFENYYGQTTRLSDPNDGFDVWNRWLGSDRYTTPQELSHETVAEMSRFFDAWTDALAKPFLKKNNRNTDAIRLLARSLDDVYFVVVRRDLVSAARSLIRARVDVQGDKSVPWGLSSHDRQGRDKPLGYVDDVCTQLGDIEAGLADQLSHVPGSNVVELTYGRFCDDPIAVLQQIAQEIPGISLRQGLIDRELKQFRMSTSPLLSAEEEHRLAQCLGS